MDLPRSRRDSAMLTMKAVAKRAQGPFSISWSARKGKLTAHTVMTSRFSKKINKKLLFTKRAIAVCSHGMKRER